MYEIQHPTNRKEDLLVNTTIVGQEDLTIENLSCQVYLPKVTSERVWLYFKTTSEEKIFKLRYFAHLFWKFSVNSLSISSNVDAICISADHVFLSEIKFIP